MRTLLVTVAVLALTAPAAAAAIPVDVRIEGASRTVFEGPVNSDVRLVQADRDATARKCDGTNNDPNAHASPTATSVTVDALALIGKGFDGRWYHGTEDYLITRLGDESSGGWGLYRGDVRSPVGGCQLPVQAGDSVLWAASTGGGETGVIRIAVTGSNPYAIAATDQAGSPVAGATVYDAGTDGSLLPTGVVTDSAGRAGVTFGPGYHRLKVGKAGLVRSARVVVCVEPCGQAPADVIPRALPPASQSGVVLSRPNFSRSGDRRGVIRLSWRFTQMGVGIRSWAIASDDLSTKARRYTTRARGSTATSATLRMPAGRTYALRYSWVDRLLRPGQTDFGRALVPIDDRSRSVKRSRGWRKRKWSKAWKGTVLRGRRGARIKVKLPAGRPALLLRGRGRATVRINGRKVRVRPGPKGGRRIVRGRKRKRSGTVTVTISRGSIDLDGVAVSP